MKENRSKPREVRSFEIAPSQATDKLLLFWAGVLFLVVAAGASLMLALDRFALSTLPGCGPLSGCMQATRGAYGKIPVLNWPLSLVGLAYFASALAVWLSTRGRLSIVLRCIAAVGAVKSIVLTIIMVMEGYVCLYCLTVHIANGCFVVLAMAAPRRMTPSLPGTLRRELLAGLGTLVIVGAALAVIDSQTARARQQRDEAERARSTQEIIDRAAASNPVDDNDPSRAVYSPPGGFTGRWRIGSEDAPIRIVIYSDFQCKDCRAFEMALRPIIANRSDISVSSKHFPLCPECNIHLQQNMHPNACWAARAAEAAGILYGTDGFWKMHHWLFDRGGGFTEAELRAGLRELGFDAGQFISVMTSSQTLETVKADIEEAYSLGLYFTPMVFINGVELRGFVNNPAAIQRTIDELTAKHLPPGSPLNDKPPLATGKAVEDWRQQQAAMLPPKPQEWALGPADARTTVWVWGDYQSSFTAELDSKIRSAMETDKSIRYVYRHYPMDKSCNPNMMQTISSAGCWAARAAEAAGRVAGNDGYWKMHDWLMKNQNQLNDETLRQAAPTLGFDANALLAAMASPEVANALAGDVASGRMMAPQGGVPTVYVNGKWVARWKLDSIDVLGLILKECARGK